MLYDPTPLSLSIVSTRYVPTVVEREGEIRKEGKRHYACLSNILLYCTYLSLEEVGGYTIVFAVNATPFKTLVLYCCVFERYDIRKVNLTAHK